MIYIITACKRINFTDVGVAYVQKCCQQCLNTCTWRKEGYDSMATGYHLIYPYTNLVLRSGKDCLVTPSTPNKSCHRLGHGNSVYWNGIEKWSLISSLIAFTRTSDNILQERMQSK